MKKWILGFICGALNGLFGSGGGTAAVPLLESIGLEPKKSHATSVALIFIFSLATTVVYLLNGNLDTELALKYIPYGIVGAITGAVILKKIPNSLLRRIFGAIVLISAIRLFLK